MTQMYYVIIRSNPEDTICLLNTYAKQSLYDIFVLETFIRLLNTDRISRHNLFSLYYLKIFMA